jgi:TPP-dependent pyruvate/acetoin dehydrogenase alpha subunit
MQLYAAMVKSRMLAERTAEWVRDGKLPHHWGNEGGSEATLAGTTADLRPDDTVSAPGNPLLWSVIDGTPVGQGLGPIAVLGHGPSAARQIGIVSAGKNGHSAHVPAPRSQGIDLEALTEAATAHKAAKDDRIALAYFRDPRASDVPGKQLRFVSRHNLPMVLLCHFSATEQQERFHSSREEMKVATEALAFGVARIAVDARDVLAVYRVASESISRARRRGGPTLIECVDHALPAPPVTRIAKRSLSDLADPIRAMESYLGKSRIPTAALKQKIESQFCLQIDAAMQHLMN